MKEIKMRRTIFALASLVTFAIVGCHRSEEPPATQTTSPPDQSASSEETTPRWEPIEVEQDQATGLDQLVATEEDFRRWEWSLRQTLNLFYPDEWTYEARIGEQPIAEIRIWIAQGGIEPTKNEEGTIHVFSEPGRFVESRRYSAENGFTYVRYSYDEIGRLVAKETRSAPTNVGWDDAEVASDYTVAYEYFEHPGFPERIYRVAKRTNGAVDRVAFEEETVNGWRFGHDGRFGGWASLELWVRTTSPILLGEVMRESTSGSGRLHFWSRLTVERSDIGLQYVAVDSGGGSEESPSWTPIASIRYTFAETASALQLAEHRNEREGLDDGVTEYGDHDERGNWLQAIRIQDGEVRHIIVREIRYF